MRTAVIFCGGGLDMDELPDMSEALVICADGGLRHAKARGITPDMVIGDCDSMERAEVESFPHIVYPSEKDETDTQLCVDYAIRQGCREIWILGGLGGRLDHEYSNFALLLYGRKRGVTIKLMNRNNEIWMADAPFELSGGDKKYISFFPYGGAVERFSLQGFKYNLEETDLNCDAVLTACNECLTDTVGRVSFAKGYLLVMACRDEA